MQKLGPEKNSFFNHWDELRKRLVASLAAFGVCSFLFYSLADPLRWLIIKPVENLVFTSPAEAFTTRIVLTLWGGFLFSLPVTLYQVWQFVALGLKVSERKYIRIFGPLSLILFLSGVLFAYFFLVPISLKFLLGFASDVLQPMIMVDRYVSFVGTLMISCGVVFEMPLVLAFLSKIGIATPEFLRQKRKYAVILILVISAVITPPDVVTQILLAAPLIILYEFGILCSRWALPLPQDPG